MISISPFDSKFSNLGFQVAPVPLPQTPAIAQAHPIAVHPIAKAQASAKRSPHPRPPSANPITPPSANSAGLSEGEAMDGDGLALPLLDSGFLNVKACTFNPLAIPCFAEAKRAYREAMNADRISIARAAAKRSPSAPTTTPARHARIPRRRRSSRRRAGVSFRFAA